MQCPKCQSENREEARFCDGCGTPLIEKCPNCGNELRPTARFCDKCGHALEQLELATPIDYSQPQSYTPKVLADKILDTRSSIEGERKLVTVLFADVANYTSMSEKLDPEEVHQIMDGCFKVLMDEIHRYEGTIDKFTGDGVMALFGVPVAHEDHAQRACYSALAIQRAIGEYGEKVNKECGVDFKMRVGINSGLVIVGSVGNDLRMDYTAIGDTTNLASRMETMAKPGAVLVSADTCKLSKDFFKFKQLGKVEVKGKEEPVEAYQLVEAGEVETRIEASVARGLTKFVGRKKEIRTLKEAFEKAQSGSGQVVGIVGEAGVGKSRIILELRGMLHKKEYIYLQGRCLHYGGSMPYLPFLDILRSYFDIKEGDREFVIKKKMADKVSQLDDGLKNILPPLHDILSLKVEDEEYSRLDPSLKRARVFEGIRDLLIRESQDETLILSVEDLHWIDKTSDEFLDYFIGSLAGAHIMLILLYRPEYTHQWGSKSYYSQIGVDQLSAETSAQLVQSILGEGKVVPELQELILNRAAGNPLFMEEFTHTLVENGSIQKKDHQYVLNIKASEIQVPNTIQGIIAARMDRLEDNLKRTMQIASVIGEDFAYRILQTITGMQEELKSYLVNLQGLEFIYEKSLFPELEYIFKHALIQDVAYNSLLLKRRKEIHERIGNAIEELYAERLEEFYEMLAHHYSRSEDMEKSFEYLKLSGDKAARNYSAWEAFRFYREAVNLLNSMPDTDENKRRGIEVRHLMAIPMMTLGYPEDSLKILQEGERFSKELGDDNNLAKFYCNMGLYYVFKGDPLRGITYAENAFNRAEKIQDIELITPIGFELCTSYLSRGDFSKIIEVAPKVIALLEKTQIESVSFGRGEVIYSTLLSSYGYAMGCLGKFQEGQALCEKGLRYALERDNLNCLAMVESFYGWIFADRGDGENAVEHFRNAIRYCEETQNISMLGPNLAGAGWGYYLLEELETSRNCAEKSIQLQSDAEIPYFLAVAYWVLAAIHLDSGELEKARGCGEKSLELSQKHSEEWVEGNTRILLGRILGKIGPPNSDKAKEYIMQGIGILNELKIKPYLSQGYLYLGELFADMGQQEKAVEALKKAEAMYHDMGMDYWLRRTQSLLKKIGV
jgi:class 3 adenylate cyclase/tetratricopeptide (TPR) repeat protein